MEVLTLVPVQPVESQGGGQEDDREQCQRLARHAEAAGPRRSCRPHAQAISLRSRSKSAS
jgi:hypothetical protein